MTIRSLVLAALIALPTLMFAFVGGYAIWQNGSLGWVWWLMTGCALVAWGLALVWRPTPIGQRHRQQMQESSHWTPRDREAAKIVRDYQLQVDSYSTGQLTDPHFYLTQIQVLAAEVAQLYHPKATDPLKDLTVPEVLAALRLAVDDMERWMLESIPGSRVLTIGQWKMLQKAPKWAQRASETAWGASVLLNPLNIARYFASRWSWGSVTGQLQTEFLAIVYLRFIRQTGMYLIEMNSGRLRAGADVYRDTFKSSRSVEDIEGQQSEDRDSATPPITIALFGQVSSGKSSIINVLTGTAQAAVDVLPETQEVQRYQWLVGESQLSLTLLDTPGYGESGETKQQLKQIQRALESSDAALLVMDAHSPARDADRRLLEQLQEMYRAKPQLKPPPVIGVLTHVDLLAPPLEWSPPYNWRSPDNAKARSLHDAVEYIRELFGTSLVEIIPVCSEDQSQRGWGVLEELLPAIVQQLDDVRSVALLRAFENQLDRGRWKHLAHQVKRSGRALLQAWIDERLSPRPERH